MNLAMEQEILAGTEFGRLKVISPIQRGSGEKQKWLCMCSCGKEKIVRSENLLRRETKSCGCLHREFENLEDKRFGTLVVVRCINKEAYGDRRWLCKCDCGGEIDSSGSSLKQGKTIRCRACYLKTKIGAGHSNWKGGKYRSHGYIRTLAHDHPESDTHGYIPEHILVMEEAIGRYLYPGETVHHVNGIRDDNRPENLELWASNHPSGQRAKDLLKFAHEIIAKYSFLEEEGVVS